MHSFSHLFNGIKEPFDLISFTCCTYFFFIRIFLFVHRMIFCCRLQSPNERRTCMNKMENCLDCYRSTKRKKCKTKRLGANENLIKPCCECMTVHNTLVLDAFMQPTLVLAYDSLLSLVYLLFLFTILPCYHLALFLIFHSFILLQTRK